METKLLAFFAFLEGQVDTLGWGTISGNVILINGAPKLETANFVRNKRLKFPLSSPASVVENFVIVAKD